ncbi:MAG: hypothetical protein CL613_01080 [Aquimarina sp.]|nr:hypothetical protein [Aquimarina sp.]
MVRSNEKNDETTSKPCRGLKKWLNNFKTTFWSKKTIFSFQNSVRKLLQRLKLFLLSFWNKQMIIIFPANVLSLNNHRMGCRRGFGRDLWLFGLKIRFCRKIVEIFNGFTVKKLQV